MSLRIDEISQTRTAKKFIKDSKTGALVEKMGTTTIIRPVHTIGWRERFVHFLIDQVLIYSLFWLHMAKFGNYSFFNYNLTMNYFGVEIVTGPMYILYFILYYAGFESIMQRTPGKLVTNTVVVNEYAEKPGLFTILVRTFCRQIPFEIFSCLSARGWHDRISSTWVVTTEERDKLQKFLAMPRETDSPLESGFWEGEEKQ